MMIDPNIASLGYDGSFEVDSFVKPRLKSETEIIKDVILFILFTKPGQYPSLPNIGLDIQSMLYSFYDELDDNDLKNQIIRQCNVLGTYFDNGTINIKKIIYKNKPSLLIFIQYESSMDHTNSSDDNKDLYQIGITFDELDHMIYNILEGRGV
jgi:hypothetical protein